MTEARGAGSVRTVGGRLLFERGRCLPESSLVFPSTAGVPAEVAEACLAHVPRRQVVQAHQRSNLLERRAEVTQAWCDLRHAAIAAASVKGS